MRYPLLSKELKNLFKSKTTLINFVLLFSVIDYSFYSSVDLYSIARVAAVDNPLYTCGFEPMPGVFVPTFGGFFIIISLIAPFLFIQSSRNEKKHEKEKTSVQAGDQYFFNCYYDVYTDWFSGEQQC